MLHNVIELGKSEFKDTLNMILGAIYCRNIEKKGNKEGKEGKKKRNKDNEHEEKKYVILD